MVCDLDQGGELSDAYLTGLLESRLKVSTKPTKVVQIAIFKFESLLDNIERSLERLFSSLDRINQTKDRVTDPEIQAYIAKQEEIIKKEAKRLVADWDKNYAPNLGESTTQLNRN